MCPPITRWVMGILFSIFLGLLGDCIYDGIKAAVDEQKEEYVIEERSEEVTE